MVKNHLDCQPLLPRAVDMPPEREGQQGEGDEEGAEFEAKEVAQGHRTFPSERGGSRS
jgi:hypothetical protein